MMSCGDTLALERESELVTPLDLAQTIIVTARITTATPKPRYLRMTSSFVQAARSIAVMGRAVTSKVTLRRSVRNLCEAVHRVSD